MDGLPVEYHPSLFPLSICDEVPGNQRRLTISRQLGEVKVTRSAGQSLIYVRNHLLPCPNEEISFISLI